MKDILKHYSKYILLDTLVAATLFAGAHGILSLFHLKFIEWFYYAVIGIITIGILLGIFQLLLKIRKNYVKYVAICVEAVSYTHLDVYKRQVVVQPFEDGTFRYLSNSIEQIELELPPIAKAH